MAQENEGQKDATNDKYAAIFGPIEKEYRARLDQLVEDYKGQISDAQSRISKIESDFTDKFKTESLAALERLQTAVGKQQEKLEKSLQRGLLGLAGAVIVIGLVAIGAIYQTAQTQVAKAGADFQHELASAYKEISAARLEATNASAEIQTQKAMLEEATKKADAEVNRLKTLPSR